MALHSNFIRLALVGVEIVSECEAAEIVHEGGAVMYEAPAIIYECDLEIQAGSPLGIKPELPCGLGVQAGNPLEIKPNLP